MTTRGERRLIFLLGWMMLSGATGPGMATPPRASAASTSLVLENGLLSGRAAGDTPAEVVSLVARAGGVAVRWAGSPGCGPRTVELAGAPVDEALLRLLGREGRSFGLRFRRTGAREALAEVVVFSESTPVPPCPARADDREPVVEGGAVGSPSTGTDVAERPVRPPDPGAEDSTTRELLDVLAHDGDAVVRAAALERILEIDPHSGAAIEQGLRDPDLGIRLAAVSAIEGHPAGADWVRALQHLAAADEDEAVRNLAASVLQGHAPPRHHHARPPRLSRRAGDGQAWHGAAGRR